MISAAILYDHVKECLNRLVISLFVRFVACNVTLLIPFVTNLRQVMNYVFLFEKWVWKLYPIVCLKSVQIILINYFFLIQKLLKHRNISKLNFNKSFLFDRNVELLNINSRIQKKIRKHLSFVSLSNSGVIKKFSWH